MTNIVTNIVLSKIAGYVGTNTPAFQAWALSFLVGQANFLAERWDLPVAQPIDTSRITYFFAAPLSNGLYGGIHVDGRWIVAFAKGKIEQFIDDKEWTHASDRLYGPGDEFERYRRFRDHVAEAKTTLSTKEAVALAREKLRAIGIDQRTERLREPPSVNQWSALSDSGRSQGLQHFKVTWRTVVDNEPIYVEISGITTNVVRYYNAGFRTPRQPPPTNYWQMLGLPEPAASPGRRKIRTRRRCIHRTALPSRSVGASSVSTVRRVLHRNWAPFQPASGHPRVSRFPGPGSGVWNLQARGWRPRPSGTWSSRRAAGSNAPRGRTKPRPPRPAAGCDS